MLKTILFSSPAISQNRNVNHVNGAKNLQSELNFLKHQFSEVESDKY